MLDEESLANLQGIPQRSKPAQGWLRVAMANKAKGLVQVVLPQPAIPVGESMFIDESQVKRAVAV